MPSYEINTETGTVAETFRLYGPTGQVDTIRVEPGSLVATIDTDIIPTVRVIGRDLDAYVAARLASGWSWH